jgi:murein DD-endopeptidase MepM/ murein hydrolase activator NlpD
MFFNIHIKTTKAPTLLEMTEIKKTIRMMRGIEDINTVTSFLEIDKLKTKKYPNGDVKLDWSCYDDFAKDTPDGNIHAYCIHLSRREAKELGINGVKGSYDSDHDNTMEFFIVADSTRKPPKNRSTYTNEFVWLFLHELCHGCERFLNGYEGQLTHEYDYEKHNLDSLYKQWDWTSWGKKKGILDDLKDRLAGLLGQKLTKPVPEKYWGNSQKYGVKSNLYKRTETHIGQDHGCPVGTKLVAPANGRIVAGGLSTELGQYLIYEYAFKGKTYWERYAHLSDKEVYGNFKAGERIGFTGNTGLSTGPHLHQEVWTIYPDISKITKDNYTQFTIDPIKHYV